MENYRRASDLYEMMVPMLIKTGLFKGAITVRFFVLTEPGQTVWFLESSSPGDMIMPP